MVGARGGRAIAIGGPLVHRGKREEIRKWNISLKWGSAPNPVRLPLLAQKNRAEVRKWLESGGKAVRSLGRFKRESDALKFVEALYKAGATMVIAPDIYAGKTGDQFADCLLVKLPGIPAKRKTRS